MAEVAEVEFKEIARTTPTWLGALLDDMLAHKAVSEAAVIGEPRILRAIEKGEAIGDATTLEDETALRRRRR
ncbi:MAG: hypothetical protein DRO98_01550 [Archaeoglobales archaeon]|nr:MAG: hypothetical protein DRO98_01550 [Archaeoglobales archaeon]